MATGSSHTLTLEKPAVVTATTAARVRASDDATIGAVTGGGAGAKGFGAIGAAVSTNQIGDTTRGQVDGAIVAAPTIEVKATTNTDIDAISLGGAGANTLALGGSVSLNQIGNTVSAGILGGTGHVTGDTVTVDAVDDVLIVALSGSGAGAKTAAAGAAGSYNQIGGTTNASIEGAAVQAGTVDVHAGAGERVVPPDGDTDPDGHIVAIAVGGAGAATFALGGAVVWNEFTRTIQARIADGADVATTGTASVSAGDDSSIVAVTGGGAGAGKDAVGAAFSKNTLGSTITAGIDNATVHAPLIQANATSDADIVAIAVGGTGAGTFALGGSITWNEISDTVTARITGAAGHVDAGTGTVRLKALDDVLIVAIAGAGAGAGWGAIGELVPRTRSVARPRPPSTGPPSWPPP